MDSSSRKQWIRPVILLGAMYFIFGIVFAKLAGWSVSNSMRVTWNRLGFLVSAVVFAGHIGYEHFRLGNLPRIIASHVSMAVALGAFALAVSANLHGLWVGSSHQRSLAFALVAWPALTGVPAFVVALVVTTLAFKRRSTLSK